MDFGGHFHLLRGRWASITRWALLHHLRYSHGLRWKSKYRSFKVPGDQRFNRKQGLCQMHNCIYSWAHIFMSLQTTELVLKWTTNEIYVPGQNHTYITEEYGKLSHASNFIVYPLNPTNFYEYILEDLFISWTTRKRFIKQCPRWK